MKSLFIVNTQYHLLISMGLSLNFDCTKKDLFIYDSLDTNFINIDILHEKFDNVLYYNKKDSIIPIFKDLLHNNMNFFKIKRLLNLNEYDHIFLFNDSLVENQYIINNFKKYSDGKVIYIEDGSVIYIESFKNEYKNGYLDNIKLSLKNIIFGFKYEVINNAYGIHSKIDEKMVFWPNLVVDDFKKDSKKIIELESSILTDAINCLYKDILQYIMQSVNDNKGNILIILEHIDFFNRNLNSNLATYIEILEYIIFNLYDKFTIFIKYHPRDKSNYLKELLDKYDIILIPENIPIETFYILSKLHIVSITSTALFTAAKISNIETIVSLCKIMNMDNIDLISKFKMINIKIPESKKKLLEYFK